MFYPAISFNSEVPGMGHEWFLRQLLIQEALWTKNDCPLIKEICRKSNVALNYN